MKKPALLFTLLAALPFLNSCSKSCYDEDIVTQTYVHKYGVELDAQDWESRGQHGQVYSTLANGVTVCTNYEAGVLDGDCTYTFPHSDILQRVETYSQGTMVREVLNNTAGIIQQETRYESPSDKVMTTWYDNGSPRSIENFQGDNLVKGQYFNPQNKLESTVENGNGERIVRDTYGHMVSKDVIANGELFQRTTFFPNGAIQAVTPFSKGAVQGVRKTYLPSGEPATAEQWINGQQTGITQIYQNGEKIAEVPYVAGLKDGIERRYKNGQTVVQEISWKKDQLHGPYNTYVEGNIKVDWYFKGRLVNKPTYEQMIKGV